MGAGIAANCLKAGFHVAVYNRSPGKAEALVAAGALVANSPRLVADGADIVWSMVSDDDASRRVWLGEDGLLAGAKPGAVLIESSTLSPEWVRELSEAARAKNCGFLDAPVGGSRAAANDGKLIFFVGGSDADLAKARPALEAAGATINHLGPVGAGASWKLINNIMGATHMAILSEALAMAKAAGIDREQAHTLVRNGAAASPMVVGKLPRVAESNFADPDFALGLMAKDARYAAAMAAALGVDARVIPAVAEIYARGTAKQLDAADVAAVVELIDTKP